MRTRAHGRGHHRRECVGEGGLFAGAASAHRSFSGRCEIHRPRGSGARAAWRGASAGIAAGAQRGSCRFSFFTLLPPTAFLLLSFGPPIPADSSSFYLSQIHHLATYLQQNHPFVEVDGFHDLLTCAPSKVCPVFIPFSAQ